MSQIKEKLAELGYELPAAPAPAANYASTQRIGNMVIVSGQLPMRAGKLHYVGKLGDDISAEEAVKAAELCALNVLAQLEAAIGDLDAVKQVVRLGVFVNSTNDYTAHPAAANGASDLMVAVFGEDVGAHARAAVGVGSLPLGVSVEVEGMFEIG